jgi:2-polyprenyl-3-methyl-5-hydroxy-6-metoxy-1,4-benzoquinol methylase
LHETLKGELKAVGHPFLSESMNRLKYESEAESVVLGLKKISEEFWRVNRTELSILDVGAGYGYWTGLVCDLLSKNKFTVSASALDMSSEALDVIRDRLPQVGRINADLRVIAPDQSAQAYDLVFSCYCLHHLTRANDSSMPPVQVGVSKAVFFIMDPT